MIDKLVLHIPVLYEFVKWHDAHTDKPKPYFDLDDLPEGIKTTGDIYKHEVDGVIVKDFENEKTCYESLPSSHSGLAFKFYEKGLNCDPFVEIKCSPAKLLQGHNLYGFDDIVLASSNMLALLDATYPVLFAMLNVEDTQVSEMDLNYSVFIKNPENKKLFLDHLRYVSKGQTKNRGDNYETTIYFGAKKSRLKKLKVYSKLEEMTGDIKTVHDKGYIKSAEIMKELVKTDRCKQAVRFEATIKKRFLERRGIPTNLFKLCSYFIRNNWAYEALFNDAWRDIFEALQGQEMTKMNDDTIYKAIYDAYHTVSEKTGKIRTVKVNRLFSLYQTIKALGYDHVKNMSTNSDGRVGSAFNQSISDLRDVGISQSTLQNLKKDSGMVVIQMDRYLKIDFDNQVPEGYTLPPDLTFESVQKRTKFGKPGIGVNSVAA